MCDTSESFIIVNFFSFFSCGNDLNGKACGRVIYSRNYAAKDISFGIGARATMLAGVNELAEAVKVTMGPKVTRLHLQSFHLILQFFGQNLIKQEYGRIHSTSFYAEYHIRLVHCVFLYT